MKLSDTKVFYDLLKAAGIEKDPASLSPEELKDLSGNPELKARILDLMNSSSRNLYQELEMDSPYVNTHRDVSYRPEILQLHSHSFYEILFCESGSIQYLIADKRYKIHAGDIILVPPGVSHRPLFYDTLREPYSRIVLWVSVEFIRNLTTLCPGYILLQIKGQDHFLLRTEGTSYKYLETFFKRGLKEAEGNAPLWDIALFGNTTALLVHLSRALISSAGTFPLEKQEEIDRIISYIENNYAEKITLESTAKKFHMSTSTLGKLFLGKIGISFYHFVTQRRLINSKLKIEEGNSMEEVALACGFCDYTAFYRAFKKEYGISPREYRKVIRGS